MEASCSCCFLGNLAGRYYWAGEWLLAATSAALVSRGDGRASLFDHNGQASPDRLLFAGASRPLSDSEVIFTLQYLLVTSGLCPRQLDLRANAAATIFAVPAFR
jgi:hypothetical protein